MEILRRCRQRIRRLVRTPGYGYVMMAATVLVLSTAVWSCTIARLQQGNADQLADGFLFTDAVTFRRAQFPAAHTQLLKWPLFWLLGVLHSAPRVYIAATAALCLVTVGVLAYLLFRITRRPVVLGTLYLSLACVLALVPAQVLRYAPSSLNMAMVTGRNVEYPLYIAALALLWPARRKYAWHRWGLAVLLLGVLLASDQLFLVCAAGGAALLLLWAYGGHRRSLVMLGWRWLAVSGLGWGFSRLLQGLIGHATVLVGAVAGPYGHVTTFTSLHSATMYGLQAILLNFGISLNAGWLDILPALLNTMLLGIVVYACYALGRRTAGQSGELDRASILSLLLIMSTLAAFVAYLATNHPASADARYLTIALFAGFVALATYSRTVRLDAKLLYVCGGVLGVGVVFGLVALVLHTERTMASDPLEARNQRVVRALAAHHEQILVGDFWRVLPIKAETRLADQQILPLAGCLQPRQTLTSNAWKQDLYTHSFAYLLSLQPFEAPFSRCSLQATILVYGQPSVITRIAGTRQHPTELLLLYNNGASRVPGKLITPPRPVFGVPTEGTARPTGSTTTPLADPS